MRRGWLQRDWTRHFFLLTGVLFLAFPLTSAQSTNTAEDKSQLVLSLENALNQAEVHHDSIALKLLLARSFVYTDVDGSFKNRDQWLKSVLNESDEYSELTNESQTAHVYADTIIAGMYRERIKVKGKVVVRHGRFTDTWIFQNSNWECAASQATLIGPA